MVKFLEMLELWVINKNGGLKFMVKNLVLWFIEIIKNNSNDKKSLIFN